VVSVEVDFVTDLKKAVLHHIENGLNDAGQELQGYMRSNAPKDLGDHARGYTWKGVEFDDSGELSGAFVNEVPNSLSRERGSPPGQRPSISALKGWAERRGLNPFLVARKIDRVGTDRWIRNENPLGIDRSSTPTDIKVNPDSIVRRKLNEGIVSANKFEF
jgi:hypothetical protein